MTPLRKACHQTVKNRQRRRRGHSIHIPRNYQGTHAHLPAGTERVREDIPVHGTAYQTSDQSRMLGSRPGRRFQWPQCVGMAQDLVAAGTDLTSLMSAGRWTTSRMPARYTREQEAGRGAVARYYGMGR